MKKRLLNLLLVIVMVACVLPFAASAAECKHNQKENSTVKLFPATVTCEEDGFAEYYACTVCNKVLEPSGPSGWRISKKVAVSATGHTAEEIPAEPVTCTMDGATAGEKCSVCGTITVEPTVISAKGHQFNANHECARAGCTFVCNHEGTIEITTPAKAATCTSAAMTAGEKCTVCNYVKAPAADGNALRHNYENGKCTRCGKVCNHIGLLKKTSDEKAATCVTGAISAGYACTGCDYVEEPKAMTAALGHRYNEGNITTPATCTEAGVKTFVCLNDGCRDSYTEAVPATGHSYSKTLPDTCMICCNKCTHEGTLEETTPAKEATCLFAPKTAGVKCTECNYERAGEYKGVGLGHNWVNGVCDREGCGAKCKHQNKTWLASTTATCETPGMTGGYQCDDCKEIVSGYEVVPALGHRYNEGKITTPATCTEAGVKTFVCLNDGCRDSYTEAVPATGHSYSTELPDTCMICCHKCTHEGTLEETTPAKEATCTAAPKTAGVKCTECNYERAAEYQGAGLGHDWSTDSAYLLETLVAPSCKGNNVPGRGLYKCTRCDETGYLDIPCTDCEYETWKGYPATCEKTGRTDGEWCKHCGAKGIKTNRTEIPALGHDMVLSDFVSTQPTCTEKGWGRYICTREGCDHSEGGWVDALGHDYEVLVKNGATCTNDGYEGSECKTCHHQVITKLEKTGHTEEVLPAVPATCTAAGLTEGKKCATCGEVMEAQKEVAMLEHAWADEAGVPETCKEDGYTAYKKCTACGAEEGKTVIEAAHKYDGTKKCTVCGAGDPLCKHENAIHKHTDSTCTDPGRDSFWCPDCNYEHMGEDLPLAAHTVEVQTTPATCTAKGQTVEFCTVCNQVVKSIELPMTEHNFVRGKCACGATEATRPGTTGRPESGCQHADTSTYIEPATCFISGYKVVTCKTCNTVVERETLKATGHTEKTDVYPATCTQNGAKIVTCSVCNELIRHETLKATGHSYSNGMCSDCGAADPNRYTYDFQDVHVVGGTSY